MKNIPGCIGSVNKDNKYLEFIIYLWDGLMALQKILGKKLVVILYLTDSL